MMGSLFDFLLEPAMEAGADDITKDVDSEKNAIIKGGSEQQPKEDLSKTDDIFGLKDKGNDDGGSPDDSGDQGDDTDAGGTDDPGEAQDDSDDAGNPEDGETPDQGDSPPDGGNDDQQNEQKSPFDLNQLRDSMIIFYRIISSNLDSIAAAVNRSNDANVTLIANRVSANLESLKTILFKEITENIKSQPYEKTMKTYVTCRRIYDICIQMLSKYSSALDGKKPK